MSTLPVVIIGGGVAGCASAVAAAEAGAPTILIEATRQLGGVAVQGEHRTLCGLAPIDSANADLLEPDLTASWLPALATGAPFRQGRVWLWPTAPRLMQDGLRKRLDTAGVDVRMGVSLQRAALESGTIQVQTSDGRAQRAGALIDASGGALLAGLLGLPTVLAQQWPAHRSVLHLPELASGTAARVAAMRQAQVASGGDAALALTPLDPAAQVWQLSLDVSPTTTVPVAAATAERIAVALGGTVLSHATAIAERDGGRAVGVLGLDRLFAERERGMCWAAWPREEHRSDGVAWTWPAHDRHGVPEQAVRLPGLPDSIWCVGKGAAVTVAAAAALRVTGTCLALGTAVGRRAALSVRSGHVH